MQSLCQVREELSLGPATLRQESLIALRGECGSHHPPCRKARFASAVEEPLVQAFLLHTAELLLL